MGSATTSSLLPGKSTLIKILSGAVVADDGIIEIFGKKAKIKQPSDAFNYGIETIYQDLALFDNLNFVENIFAGREYVQKGFGKYFNFVDIIDLLYDKKGQLIQMDVLFQNNNFKLE